MNRLPELDSNFLVCKYKAKLDEWNERKQLLGQRGQLQYTSKFSVVACMVVLGYMAPWFSLHLSADSVFLQLVFSVNSAPRDDELWSTGCRIFLVWIWITMVEFLQFCEIWDLFHCIFWPSSSSINYTSGLLLGSTFTEAPSWNLLL